MEQPTILIAEDDPATQRLLESALRQWGYTVRSVADGDAAWRALEPSDGPMLAILDWMMPGMDGVEVCAKVRKAKQGAYPYLILLTAKDGKEDVVVGLEAGADDYMTKPFDLYELKARLRAGGRILALQQALIEAQEALRDQAMHDSLTGLLNRPAILSILERELARSRREGTPSSLLLIDFDHFKDVNDTYGHLGGDVVLREAAHRIASAVRDYDGVGHMADGVGRYGGEEMLVVLPKCGMEAAMRVAERLRRLIAEEPMVTSEGTIDVTISVGVASSDGSTKIDAKSLIRAADAALYQAKRDGRNRVEAGTSAGALSSRPPELAPPMRAGSDR